MDMDIIYLQLGLVEGGHLLGIVSMCQHQYNTDN